MKKIHRQRISIALKKYFSTHDHVNKGIKFSESHKKKISLSRMLMIKNGWVAPYIGRHHSQSVKKRMSHSRKILWQNPTYRKKQSYARKKFLREHPEVMLGERNPFFGRKHSSSAKKIMSEKHIGMWVGEKSPKWCGGKSFEPYSPEFNMHTKRKVRDYFNNRCVICFEYERDDMHLDIHHVDRDKNNNSLDNLVPVHHGLCHKIVEDISFSLIGGGAVHDR